MESSEQEALRNSLILHTVMLHLSPPDMKNIRLVNKSFNSSANSNILHQNFFQIRFKSCRCPINQTFIHDGQEGERHSGMLDKEISFSSHRRSLASLNHLLRQSPHFPCTNFHFDPGDLLFKKESQEFFTVFGYSIKTLGIHFSNSSENQHSSQGFTKETLFNILTVQAPYIDHLQIDEHLTSLDPPLVLDAHFTLPNLKQLTLLSKQNSETHPTDHDHSLQTLLNPAVNLEAIYEFTPVHTTILEHAQKLHLVKSMRRFKIYWPSNWTILDTTRFADSFPQLRILQLGMPGQGYSQPKLLVEKYLRILKSSRNSLRTLEMSELLYGDESSQSEFPILSNLNKLILKEPRGSGGRFFSENTCLHRCFPKLKILSLGHCYDWEKHFPLTGQFQGEGLISVQTLEIEDNLSEISLKRLHEICPNFKKLVLKRGPYRVDKILKLIWIHWTHLQFLEIHLKNLINLDSAFTGFAVEDCQRWCGDLDEEVEWKSKWRVWEEGFEKLEREPWIGKLVDLRELQIYFENPSLYTATAAGERPFTRLTGLLAFDRMKKLNVTIGHNQFGPGSQGMKNLLKPLFSFAKIVHYHQKRWEWDEE